MSLVLFLLQTSGPALGIALVTGLVSGGCSAALIALISYTIAQGVTGGGVCGPGGDRILKLDYGQIEFEQSPSAAKNLP